MERQRSLSNKDEEEEEEEGGEVKCGEFESEIVDFSATDDITYVDRGKR